MGFTVHPLSAFLIKNKKLLVVQKSIKHYTLSGPSFDINGQWKMGSEHGVFVLHSFQGHGDWVRAWSLCVAGHCEHGILVLHSFKGRGKGV